jgi:hypothetical protein
MRLIKAQNTNLRNIYGKGVKYDVNDQIIMDSNNVVLVPKGTTGERPTSPEAGHMRYNTTLNELEIYSESEWRSVRYKEPNNDPGIVQQDLGFGDDVETFFGPLDSQDPNTDYTAPAAAQNIFVYVDNVWQRSGVGNNYVLTQDPAGKPAGWYIEFSSAPPSAGAGGDPVPVTALHNFDK